MFDFAISQIYDKLRLHFFMKVYSRFEIESLKRAEKHLQDAYDNAEHKANSLGEFIKQLKQ